MNENERIDLTEQHWFRTYRDYWTGIIVMSVLYNIVKVSTGTRTYGVIGDFIFGFIFYLILMAFLAGLTFLIAWLFKRNFLLSRFIKHLTVWAFITLLTNIISKIMGG